MEGANWQELHEVISEINIKKIEDIDEMLMIS